MRCSPSICRPVSDRRKASPRNLTLCRWYHVHLLLHSFLPRIRLTQSLPLRITWQNWEADWFPTCYQFILGSKQQLQRERGAWYWWMQHLAIIITFQRYNQNHGSMGLLPDTKNCGCACAGNAANVFPTTAGKRSRHASRHVRRTCRDACRDRLIAVSF